MRQQPLRAQVRLGVGLVQLAEDVLVAALTAERLDRLDAAERLDELDDHRGDRRAGAPVGDRRLAPEPGRQPDQRREARHHHQCQPPVQQQHAAADQQQREHGRDQVGQALVEQVSDRVHVGDLAGDDPAGGVLLVEGDRQFLEVPEQPPSQFQHDPPAQPADAGDVGAGGRGLHDYRHREGSDDQGKRAGVASLLQPGDGVDSRRPPATARPARPPATQRSAGRSPAPGAGAVRAASPAAAGTGAVAACRACR